MSSEPTFPHSLVIMASEDEGSGIRSYKLGSDFDVVKRPPEAQWESQFEEGLGTTEIN